MERFIIMHQQNFKRALREIRCGHKESHWIWYIFPQLKGLGKSPMSDYYGLNGKKESTRFINHYYLGQNLKTITQAVLDLPTDDIYTVFEDDDIKFHSCMTLFYLVTNDDLFKQALDRFFNGVLDENTLTLLKKR